MSKKTQANVIITKPDGLWGWWTVAAEGYVLFVWFVCMKCFAAFYFPLMSEFDVEYAEVSWLLGLYEIGYAISCATSPILFKFIDYRTGVMLGSVIATFFFFISTYANALWQVQVCCGLASGLVLGWMAIGCSTSLARYFEKYRMLGFQIASLGSSLSGIVGCFLFQYFISAYTWRGAWQLIAGVFLNIAVFGALLRPITLQSDLKESKLFNLESEIKMNSEISLDIICNDEEESMTSMSDNSSRTRNQSSTSATKLERIITLCKAWDLDLVISIDFYLYIGSWVSFAAGYHNSLSYLVPFGQSIGLDDVQAAALVSGLCTGEIISRIYQALVFLKLPRKFHYPFLAGCTATSVIFFFAIPHAKSYMALLILSSSLGLCVGGIDAVYITILAELFDLDKYAAAYGYTNIFNHFLGMGITVLIGSLIDLTGNVAVTFYVGGAGILITSFLILVVDKRIKYKQKIKK